MQNFRKFSLRQYCVETTLVIAFSLNIFWSLKICHLDNIWKAGISMLCPYIADRLFQTCMLHCIGILWKQIHLEVESFSVENALVYFTQHVLNYYIYYT